ncbi:adenosylcobinamide amidohydrolase [Allocatelliglobosispora scoriae]|uniref:Adenosylcobinamide amidohydrolase n=1 Tax=Allocatelliglobosispora scoriae TaxID=643052 RepID=A0A841BUU5_9ACTN|nr:adenosylcobinamide amidohydrolase [Allocatelliglobosispora scoriae]
MHLTEIAAALNLDGSGVGLMTGVDVTEVVSAAEGAVTVWATVGLGSPILAAASIADAAVVVAPGTVNIVASLPVRLSDAALVNAVSTVTEAKVQALRDLGIHATGTATDATCLVCPASGRVEAYGGPRSVYGSVLARVTYDVLMTGGRRWMSRGLAWSDRR